MGKRWVQDRKLGRRRVPSYRTRLDFHTQQLVRGKKLGLHREQILHKVPAGLHREQMHRMMPAGHRRELTHRKKVDLLREQWQQSFAGVVWGMTGSSEFVVCKIVPQV